MQTFDELATELKLSPKQSQAIKAYFESLIIELLESLKVDNLENFEDTINSVRSG
jgi:hypothetical protein